MNFNLPVLVAHSAGLRAGILHVTAANERIGIIALNGSGHVSLQVTSATASGGFTSLVESFIHFLVDGLMKTFCKTPRRRISVEMGVEGVGGNLTVQIANLALR